MTINLGSALSLLRPGLNKIWGLGYTRIPEQFSQVYEMFTSNMTFERDVNIYGLGVAKIRADGAATELDDMAEGWKYDYVHNHYASGFKVTHLQVLYNQYLQFTDKAMKELGNGFRETKELLAAAPFNLATSNTVLYGDGQPLLSRSHEFSAGGTYSNMPDVDADLSEKLIEDAVTQIMGYTDDRGKRIVVNPVMPIVARANWANISRIIKTELRVGTANNDINVIRAENVFSKEPMVWRYLDDEDAVFIKTDCEDGFKHFVSEGYSTKSYIEDATDSIVIQGKEGYSFGCTNTMAIWGTPGG